MNTRILKIDASVLLNSNKRLVVIWFLTTLPALISASGNAQTRFVETFDKMPIDRARWRLPKATVYSEVDKQESVDATSRFFLQKDGELTISILSLIHI